MVLKAVFLSLSILVPAAFAANDLPLARAGIRKSDGGYVGWPMKSQWKWLRNSQGATVLRLQAAVEVPSDVTAAASRSPTLRLQLRGQKLILESGALHGKFQLTQAGSNVIYQLDATIPKPPILFSGCAELGLRVNTNGLPVYLAAKCYAKGGKGELHLTIPEEATIDQSTLFEQIGKGEPWRVYELSRASLGGGETATITVRYEGKSYDVLLVWAKGGENKKDAMATSPRCSKYVPFNSQALDEAVNLSDKGRHKDAHMKIESEYDPHCPEIPPRVAFHDCEFLGRLERWDEASFAADRKLDQRVPWLKSYYRDASNEDSVGLGYLEPDDDNLMWCAAESRSQYFASDYNSLSPTDRNRIKHETRALTDLLTKRHYDPKKIEKILSRIPEREEGQKKQRWFRRIQAFASYYSWEERSSFFSQTAKYGGRSTAFSSCFGGALSFQNGYYSFDAGGCFGIGKAHALVDANNFDSGASVQLVTGFVKAMRKLSGESGTTVSNYSSAVGLETGVVNRSISARLIDGSSATSSKLDFDLMAVGRFDFGRLFLEAKGGSLIGQPSAIWALTAGLSF